MREGRDQREGCHLYLPVRQDGIGGAVRRDPRSLVASSHREGGDEDGAEVFVKWEMTSEYHWPKECVEGEFPARGTNAVEQEERFQRLLADGWEPFCVERLAEASLVWLKRQT